jgi:hypothetical protein
MYISICVYEYMHMYMCICVCVYICICVYVCMCICVYGRTLQKSVYCSPGMESGAVWKPAGVRCANCGIGGFNTHFV